MADKKRGPADSVIQHRESVKAMTANGMSQRAIATALGISQSTVHRLLEEKDEERPGTLAHLFKRQREWVPGNSEWDAIK